jgi:hypothetical protein
MTIHSKLSLQFGTNWQNLGNMWITSCQTRDSQGTQDLFDDELEEQKTHFEGSN